ncbi:flagellar biosynthesis protein FlhB [Photobacterium swingsii]|uniref:Flagellar biosynthesis protein FlhB n=1 Tax=Photobacterium swingsii TaxID=680026 RepID=A0A0J8VC12_9GAMM|nr:EscU/YscU/HrcU family type III secretion system export apparatus switch protein [Photobacterium swingsii]KMV30612.1 flagellar biosynthesis protein FlhB [Photobacterium swingsii]PSW26596.1 flagellar biosynthesis protein FlhB [Photobacterium swingsii]
MSYSKHAVALHYDGRTTPQVTSKGVDQLAEHIIEQVKQQGGLIHEDPVLLEYLDKLKVGDTIPEQLYVIIAELIAFSWFINGKTPPGWEGSENINTVV